VKACRESSKFAVAAEGRASGYHPRYDYVVEVSPSNGDAPFTTTMTTPMFVGHWRTLHDGNVVTVLHRPGTEEVKWDRRERSTSKRYARKAAEAYLKHSADDEFDAALHAGPRDDRRPATGGTNAKLAEFVEFERRARQQEDPARDDE
jgi:hypothetical protein